MLTVGARAALILGAVDGAQAVGSCSAKEGTIARAISPPPNIPFRANFDFGFSLQIYKKFGCSRWICIGHDISNAFAKCQFHRLFDFVIFLPSVL